MVLFNEETRAQTWFKIANPIFSVALILFFLYFFLVGLDVMGNSFKVLAGDKAGEMFRIVENPIAGLMVGILATVLVQSSSTTTSIIVSAVGAGALDVLTAIPMVFGANIGTSVTNTLVSLGFAGNKEQYIRAFSGATVHDAFNLLNVCFWLPMEYLSSAINGGEGGILFVLSKAVADSFEECEETADNDCEKWTGPLKKITAKISKQFINVDKDVIKDFSIGRPAAELCELLCENNACVYKFSSKRCSPFTSALASTVCGNDGVKSSTKAKFLFCSENANVTGAGRFNVDEIVLADAQTHYDAYRLNKKGIFFDADMTDKVAGTVGLLVSILVICICLFGLVKSLSYVVRGAAEGVVKKALNMNGYLGIIIGALVTIFVQSSSITTSVLTPLVAIDVLTVDKMLPLTLGANIGTTCTGLLASLVGNSSLGFQIAMVHVLFNVFGVIMFYPLPFTRNIPIATAKALGSFAGMFRPFPVVYVIIVFFVYPLALLGISLGFESEGAGGIAASVLVLLLFIAFHIYVVYWYNRKGGRESIDKWIRANHLDLKDTESGKENVHESEVDLEDLQKAKAESDAVTQV